MEQRRLGEFSVSPLGLGCMNLSHAYGTPPNAEDSERLLLEALEMGYTLLDTAALYGFGANETLLGNVLRERRNDFVLTSKCGMFKNAEGKREINGRPDVIKRTCEDSLKRLQTDVIDLYYLHRTDPNIPVEESVGALGDLVTEGKIRAIGLSEVSAETLHRAHKEQPISALQSEYSLWTRNPEIAVLEACRELDVAFVAFSPLARGFLTGKLRDVALLESNDLRRNMPRFQADAYAENLTLLRSVEQVAKEEGVSVAQLSLAWLLGKGEDIIPIPGTTSLSHLAENFDAGDIELSAGAYEQLDEIINQSSVVGARYNEATQLEIGTEEFA